MSPLAVIDDTHATMIFRCTGCLPADVSDKGTIFDDNLKFLPLTAILSFTPPTYLSNITGDAILPLDGSEEHEFILDLERARFSNFSAMVEALQL